MLTNIIILQEMTTLKDNIFYECCDIRGVSWFMPVWLNYTTFKRFGTKMIQKWIKGFLSSSFIILDGSCFFRKNEITLCIPLICLQKINNSGCMGSGGQWWQLIRTRRRLMWKKEIKQNSYINLFSISLWRDSVQRCSQSHYTF